MADVIRLHDKDSVAVAAGDLKKGHTILIDGRSVQLLDDIPMGHKVSLSDIPKGENVIRYGVPIGHTTKDIRCGELVHVHNIFTNLKGVIEYSYEPEEIVLPELKQPMPTFEGYVGKDGQVGIRNEIWIIPTVFCVNGPAQRLAAEINRKYPKTGNYDGAYALTHPCGCSQVGTDLMYTQKILANLVHHPNAGGVLILGLGCEVNNLEEFLPVVGEVDPERVKALKSQDVEDEIEAGVALLDQLHSTVSRAGRESRPVSDLAIALNCGGSDALSGITANPLVGKVTDRLTGYGATVVMTEVPEMFGAEQILMNRAESKEVFDAIVKMINDYKGYYEKYGEKIYKNPVPGNIAGGISTLEEKSLGCTQKAGTAPVRDVLPYYGRIRKNGFALHSGPGNDLVCITAQEAAGCVMTIFTTGRGTPTGFATPLLRVMTNNRMGNLKRNWIDYQAGDLLEGKSMETATDELFDLILDVASGKTKTKAEASEYRQIGIWRDGVTN